MAESEEARRGTVERLRASSAALSALPQKGRAQQKTFFFAKKSKFVGIMYTGLVTGSIRSEHKELGFGRQERNRWGGRT
jgi:hypothetical protein